jgi:hypothetical protein
MSFDSIPGAETAVPSADRWDPLKHDTHPVGDATRSGLPTAPGNTTVLAIIYYCLAFRDLEVEVEKLSSLAARLSRRR